MTSLKKRWLVKVQRMLRTCRQPFEAIAMAAGQIFSPSDDDCPKIGTQPFEGDILDTRYRHHSS